MDSVVKKLYDKLFTRVNTIDTKIPSANELVTKAQYDLNEQGLEKAENVDKKYIILVGWSKRLTTIRKLQTLTTRYLVLLD